MPVLSRSRTTLERTPRSLPLVVVTVLVIVASYVASLVLLPAPADTRTITVTNSTDWQVAVEVGPADGTSRVPVGSVGRDRSRNFEAVPDRWSVLTVRYSYAGESAEQTISTDELERLGSQLEVPESLGARLAEREVSPTPTIG